MNQANRKKKLSKYWVTIRREIEHTAVMEVEARSIEEAQEAGKALADDVSSNDWREGDVIDETVTAKIIRPTPSMPDSIGLHSMVEGNREDS